MSTRANIVVVHGESVVFLYRHCDGYPSECGADLGAKLLACDRSAGAFLRSIVLDKYEQQSYERAARPVYELTTELHGDIEWLYVFDFKDGGAPGPYVGCGLTPFAIGSDRDISNTEVCKVASASVEDFIATINGHIRDQNRRILQYNRDNRTDHPAIEELKLPEDEVLAPAGPEAA